MYSHSGGHWLQYLDFQKVEMCLKEACFRADGGDLFLEQYFRENLIWDEGCVKEASTHTSQGFGLRALFGSATFYVQSPEISLPSLAKAAEAIRGSRHLENGSVIPMLTEVPFQKGANLFPFQAQTQILAHMDQFAKQLDPRIIQASFHVEGVNQEVGILPLDGEFVKDVRAFSVLSVYLTVEDKGRKEQSVVRLGGGRYTVEAVLKETFWKSALQEALRKALLLLEAVPAPAGEMPVILGSGIPGVMLHEAVGHGLEGDFNRKGLSVFSQKMGQRVASPEVTVIDDGTIKDMDNAHGTCAIDDEGTPCQRTTLIENGILVGYMQDRLNGRLMGKASTGNGRRASYAHMPLPRMTNTYMQAGSIALEDMIQDVEKGIYAVDFSGGQVDVVSGNFVFSASEAYLIENGHKTAIVKGATLTGNGPRVMENIVAIGNDLKLGERPGYCGKNGQTVLVSAGQPSLLVSSSITVGGTSR